jgi:fibronectin type 3 domain-containing protein
MFEYRDLYDWWWYVDDVCMTGTLAVALPVVLDIDYMGAGQAQLSWAAIPNATSYDIYEAPSMGGTFSFLANTTNTSYVVATPSPDKKLYYVVTRNDAAAASASRHPSNANGYGVRPPTSEEAKRSK